jgi:hypothetical protein
MAENAPRDVTGHHGTVMLALAYAIVAIERLPEEWRPESDKEAMRKLLEARTEEDDRNYYLTHARSHLERRGMAIEDGKLTVAPRDSGTSSPEVTAPVNPGEQGPALPGGALFLFRRLPLRYTRVPHLRVSPSPITAYLPVPRNLHGVATAVATAGFWNG